MNLLEVLEVLYDNEIAVSNEHKRKFRTVKQYDDMYQIEQSIDDGPWEKYDGFLMLGETFRIEQVKEGDMPVPR